MARVPVYVGGGRGTVDVDLPDTGATDPLGPIYPIGASQMGPGAMTADSTGVAAGSVLVASSAFISSPVYTPTTYLLGRQTSGPFVWGVQGNGSGVFRYDIANDVAMYVTIGDVALPAGFDQHPALGAMAIDDDGFAWTIEINTGTLVKMEGGVPKIAATYLLPDALLAWTGTYALQFDAAHQTLVIVGIESNYSGVDSVGTTFDLASAAFSTPVSIQTPVRSLELIIVADGLMFGAASRHGTDHTNVYQIDPTTFAIISTVTMPSNLLGSLLYGGSTPSLFVSMGNTIYRVGGSPLAVEATYAITGSDLIIGMAFDNNGLLWATDEVANPAQVYSFDPFAAFAQNTYSLDTVPNSNTSSIVNDTAHGQMVVLSNAIDRIYIIALDGSVNEFVDIAGSAVWLPPGTNGQVLTSQGPGLSPIWAHS